MKFDTKCIRGGYFPESAFGSAVVPIYQTTSFVFKDTDHAARLFNLEEDGFIYTRISNPTVSAFENRMVELEGGTGALATASGQSAITIALLTLLKSGDEFVSSSKLYGGTYTLFAYTFARMGIKAIFTEPTPEAIEKAITPKTKLIYAETMANPSNDVLDFEAVSSIAKKNRIPLIVDNTVATPYLMKPIDYGVNIVVYSSTKFIGGHGTSIGGVIVDGGNFDWAESGKFPELTEPDPAYHGLVWTEKFGRSAFIMKARLSTMRDIGACMSPFNAFLFIQGLETLHLRMPRHCENALKIARFLESHKKVSWVNYPGLESHPSHRFAKKYFNGGFGAIIGFGVKGGYESAKNFIDNLKMLSHLANIGDARTLVVHPASTTHQQLTREEREAAGVSDDFIRLVVGIEDPDDIIADIDQALSKV